MYVYYATCSHVHSFMQHYMFAGEMHVQKIVNETVNAGSTEQSFSLELYKNNDIVECTKTLNLILSTSEVCKATIKNNSIAEVNITNDDGKLLSMYLCIASHMVYFYYISWGSKLASTRNSL